MADLESPPNVLDYVSEDTIQDLWSIGYTVVKRAGGDPFHVPPEMVPQGRSYQWWHLVHDKFHFHREKGGNPSGWAPVPASRHDGYFMPFGHTGDIEIGGLGLFEKSKFEVDQELKANTAAAHKQVTDWIDSVGAQGLSGGVRIGGITMDVGAQPDAIYQNAGTKSIETTVKIPKDMIPHMAAIFAERDRLRDEIVLPDRSLRPGELTDRFYATVETAVEAGKEPQWWPTLLAFLLPIAIKNVRATLRSGEPNSDVNVHPDRKEKP